MPLYEFQCQQCGKRTEVLQRFEDPPPAACPACGGDLKKLFSAPAVQFKGSGFYVTDYGGKGKEGKSEGAEGKPEKAEKSDKAEKTDSGKKETAVAAESKSSGGSSSGAPASSGSSGSSGAPSLTK
jgi:putative FmdB family regulatory protein